MTATSGQFAMKDITPGKYRITVSHEGYVTANYGARGPQRPGGILTLERGMVVENLDFMLMPDGAVTGQVTDEFGEPVPYVSVQLLRMQYRQGHRELAWAGAASTNDLGDYRIFGVAPGTYYVRATARPDGVMADTAQDHPANPQPEEGYGATYFPGTIDSSGAAQIEVTSGTTVSGLNIRLTKAKIVRISGRIINNASPVRRQAQLYLISTGTNGVALNLRNQPVSANGQFSIRGITAGAYSITAVVYDGNKTYSARVPIDVGNDSVEVNMVIGPNIEVSGKVRIEQDVRQDLDGAEVYLSFKEYFGPVLNSASPGHLEQDNSFIIHDAPSDVFEVNLTNLPENCYIKSIRSGDRDVMVSGLDLTRGTPAPVEIVVSPKAGLLTGTVQNPNTGMPVPGATVVLTPQEPERRGRREYYRTITTDQNGAYTLKGLIPGQYLALAWEDLEPGAYLDPDLPKGLEAKGQSISVHEADRKSVPLQMIPARSGHSR
jgi:protocatechuate 3,4-dioxygenase beta subunit